MSKFNNTNHTDRADDTEAGNGAEFDAQVDVMKSHNQLNDSRVHRAKAAARESLNQAIAEESQRPVARGRRPLMWAGGVAAAAAAATLVAMNVAQPNNVELKPAQPTVTSTPKPQPTTPEAQDTPLPMQAPALTDSGLVDPFGLATIDQEVTFRYAAKLLEARCSKEAKKSFTTVDSMRKMKKSPETVRAMRTQSRLFWLGDTTKEDLQQLHRSILSAPEGRLPLTYTMKLSDDEQWGVGCEGTSYKIYGPDGHKDRIVVPPIPSGDRDAFGTYIFAVRERPEVKTAAQKFNKCYAEVSQQKIAPDTSWIILERFIYSRSDSPTPITAEQVWTCYEASGLQAASRKAQAQWQAAHPDGVKKWKAEPAFYASKVAAAEKMIAEEEAKVGK